MFLMYNTKHERARHVDILYYNGHYDWIKNVEKLVGCLSNDGHKVLYHKTCSSRFYDEKEFICHKQLCTSENWCSVIHTLQSPGYVLEFKNFKYQTPAPFVIYIDCESKLNLSMSIKETQRTIRDMNAVQWLHFWYQMSRCSTINGSDTLGMML